MNLALATLVVVGFALIVRQTRLIRHSRDAVERARASLSVLTDSTLGDEEKERRLRTGSMQLFGLLARILSGAMLALLLPLAGVWALGQLGWASFDEVIAVLSRVDFLVLVSLIGCAGLLIDRRLRRP